MNDGTKTTRQTERKVTPSFAPLGWPDSSKLEQDPQEKQWHSLKWEKKKVHSTARYGQEKSAVKQPFERGTLFFFFFLKGKKNNMREKWEQKRMAEKASDTGKRSRRQQRYTKDSLQVLWFLYVSVGREPQYQEENGSCPPATDAQIPIPHGRTLIL